MSTPVRTLHAIALRDAAVQVKAPIRWATSSAARGCSQAVLRVRESTLTGHNWARPDVSDDDDAVVAAVNSGPANNILSTEILRGKKRSAVGQSESGGCVDRQTHVGSIQSAVVGVSSLATHTGHVGRVPLEWPTSWPTRPDTHV